MVGEGPWCGTEQDHAGENSGMETIISRSGRGRTACSSQGADLREHASPAFAQPLFATGAATATQAVEFAGQRPPKALTSEQRLRNVYGELAPALNTPIVVYCASGEHCLGYAEVS